MANMLAGKVAMIVMQHLYFSSNWAIPRIFMDINEKVWKDPNITWDAIRALGEPPMTMEIPNYWPNERRLLCAFLHYETGDPVETFRRNLQACEYIFGAKPEQIFNLQQMKPYFADHAKRRPVGLHWMTAELGRHYLNIPPRSILKTIADKAEVMGGDVTERVLGQELPMIAATHPNWVAAMGKEPLAHLPAGQSRVFPYVMAPEIVIGDNYFCPCLAGQVVQMKNNRQVMVPHFVDVGLDDNDVASGGSYGIGQLRIFVNGSDC
jgi:hypothetical protein